jgi:hypothetical protein
MTDSDSSFLYRAIRASNWVDKMTDLIQPNAWNLRHGENGFSTDLIPEKTFQKLDSCYGILKVSKQDVLSLDFNVDNDYETHCNIIGIPNPDEEPEKYKRMIDTLIEKTKIYARWTKSDFNKIKNQELNWEDFIMA